MTRSTILLAVLATLQSAWAIDLATLPIPTFRLDLTIKNRRQLRGLQQSIDSTIQSVAEEHLAVIYADEFTDISPPSQVLLTVVTAESNSNSNTNGIYIRSSFLGGVVSFPTSSNEAPPSRSELERATLRAFAIPGVGESFLKALGDRGHPELEGLLLIGATEVMMNYDDNDDKGGRDSVEPAPSTYDNNDDNSTMNIWAVAAVAALGAMFLVIVLCTSILYCDWRKRKERREKKRERAMMAAAASNDGNRNYHRNNGNNKKGSITSIKSSNKSVEFADAQAFEEPPQLHLQSEALQIVVQADSGETEMLNISPSTQGSNDKDNFANTHSTTNFNNNATSGRGFMFQKIKSSRRLPKVVKSKAANAQLQDYAESSSATLSQDYQTSTEDYDNGIAAEIEPSIADYSVGEDTTMLYPTIHRGRLSSKDRSDNMSDFDGYSMDGMSAIVDGGFSAYGGSAGGSNGGDHVIGAHSKKRDVMYSGDVPRDFDSVWGDDDQSKMTMDASIDNAYTPPMMSSNNNNVKDSKQEAYGDLTKNLDELVEHEYEESSHSAAGSAVIDRSTINLHEFDSESESGSTNKGAFTLELLGKGPTKASQSSTAPSQEDEDSILGDMYRDETSELGLGGEEDGHDSVIGGEEKVLSSGESVDSTPSWAAPIQSALRNSVNIFRTSSGGEDDKENDDAASNKSNNDGDDASLSSSKREAQEQRTKQKFVSSLSGSDDGSVGSNHSGNIHPSSGNNITSNNNNGKNAYRVAKKSRKETTAKSSDEKALGLTNSMEEEVDEDPSAMIDNINSMLSECREILDTENPV
mmetsp:Transcript_6443/g.11209  ORF Transcript_6443/g.11209 Transcript_6443/m.11209 type:complete len:809 (+) Transcript_6443:183-2609(+)